MGLEIEAKFRIDAPDAVRGRLQSVGAGRMGRVLETNTIFDTRDGALSAADHGLRVRSAVSLEDPSRTVTLTFKGPRLATDLKTRPEIEVTISDADKARQILGALGFVEALVFQKRRETWKLGACSVELDELPELGWFVEIEGPDEQIIRSVQTQLGLDAVPILRDTYISMLVRHRRTRGAAPERFLFDS